MTDRSEPKTTCRTPNPGKKPTRIPTWKYELVRKAILRVVPRREPGVEFRDLPLLVEEVLIEDERERLGSIMWHVTTVKLDLETRGEIRRVDKASPQRLVRESNARSSG